MDVVDVDECEVMQDKETAGNEMRMSTTTQPEKRQTGVDMENKK